MQNGMPFWYFHGHGGALAGTPVKKCRPERAHRRGHPARAQVIGCVVYPASELIAPGVVRHIEGDRFPLGELDGSVSERVQRVAACFVKAGFKSPVLDDIRAEIWLKLWGNLTFNPISSLAHATLQDICQFPLTRELAAAMMTEAQTVANKLGISFRVQLDKRIAGAEKVGKHKTSMLQDIEAGRAPEIDALVGVDRRTRPVDRHADAAHRHRVRAGQAAGQDDGRGKGPAEAAGGRLKSATAMRETASAARDWLRALWPAPIAVDGHERLRVVCRRGAGHLATAWVCHHASAGRRRPPGPGWWRRWAPARCWCSACRPARWRSPGRWSAATRCRRWWASPACAGSATPELAAAVAVAPRSARCSRCAACTRRAVRRRCWWC